MSNTNKPPRIRKSAAPQTEVRIVKADEVKTRKRKTESEAPAAEPAAQ